MALSAKRPSGKPHPNAEQIDALLFAGAAKKRLNVEIEIDLYKRIQLRVLEEGRSISAITRQLWLEYLSN